METNNIDKYFKKLSDNQKPKDFSNMENVWNKVEERLDKKEKKRIIPYLRYTGIAAALLMFVAVGNFLWKDNKTTIEPNTTDSVVTIDKEKIEKTFGDSVKTNGINAVAIQEKETKNTKSVPIKTEEVFTIVEPDFKEDVVAFSEEEVFIEETLQTPTGLRYVKSLKPSETLALAAEQELSKTKEQQEQTNVLDNETIHSTIVAKINEREKALRTITGTVTEFGMPLPGASVVVKGTTNGTQTDFDGKYSIKAKKDDVLEFSYIGMKAQQVTVAASDVINVQMQEDNVTLSEVVVVGYGAQKKNKLTSVVKAEEIRDKKVVANRKTEAETIGDTNTKLSYDINQSLQGQVAGVNITSASGKPEKKDKIIIRGKSSIQNGAEPLYILDGEPISSENLKKIKSEDIGAMNILKDAAATSIYGSRGANGVIIIQSQKDLKKNGKMKSDSIKIEDIHKIFPPVEIDTESYESFVENPFESAFANPVSTFSIDVDNASYTNIRRFINNGQTVPKDAVRIEEMINFFKYDYPQPKDKHPFSINTEYSDAPWNPNHKLLKIGLKGKEIPSEKLPKSNFVFLVDVSGSMSSANKLPLLQASMKVLLDELRDDDRVSIVYYASGVGVLLEPTKASQKEQIIKVIDNLRASGGTSGGAGLELAYKMAEKHFVKGGNNRIILATDGDFNIGKSSDKDMQELIEEKRKSGVFLTCLGFGMGNYKDSKMMTLSKKGNGNYAYIDNIQEANRFLGKEFKGSMYAIAKDVKIQIEFNPKHVQAYRLVGYETRKLRNEDFTNDSIDAGELGSGHTVTALYEVIPTGIKSVFYEHQTDLKYTQTIQVNEAYQNELATVKFRYKKPDGDISTEMIRPVLNQNIGLDKVSKDFKFASSVAWFGLKLRDSKLIQDKDIKAIIKLAREGIQNDTDGYKVEFVRLAESVK